MAETIYKVFMGRMTEAYYQLSEAKRAELLDKNRSAMEAVGSEMVGMGDSTWSSDKYAFFGLQKFPSMDALREYHRVLLNELEWFRYVEAETLIGSQWEE